MSESSRVADTLLQRLGIGQPDVVALLHRPGADVRDPVFATRVLDALEVLMEDPGVATALSYYDSGLPSLVSRDGHRSLHQESRRQHDTLIFLAERSPSGRRRRS